MHHCYTSGMPKTPRPNGLEIYKAKDGYRWRLWSQGRIKADSGEAYTRKEKLRKGLTQTAKLLQRWSKGICVDMLWHSADERGRAGAKH